jgi:hypothetical protein
MLVLERILAIPDQSIDYLQCGIAGKERAALEARGFVRKDGTKAKDYMIRTIQKTSKNKEKAIIKGDKKLNETPDKKELEQGLSKINQELQTPYLATAKFKPLVVSNPDRFESLSKEAKQINTALGNKKREFYESTQDQASRLLRMPAARHKKYVEDALKSGKTVPTEVLKDYPDLAKQYSKPSNKIAVTYNKQGDLSAGSAAKKIKGAIAGVKGGKVVKGESPDTRNAGYINYGGGKAQNGKIRLVDYRNKDVNAYVAKLDENGDRKFVNDHGKADTNAFKGKENVKEWNIKKLEDGVYEANSRQGVGTRGVEKSYFSVKKGKIDNYFDNYQQAKEVLTPKEKRINKTSLSGSSDKQISYAESVRDKAITKLQSKGLSPSDIQKAVSDPQTQTARWWLDNKDNAVDKIYNTMMKQKISRL